MKIRNDRSISPTKDSSSVYSDDSSKFYDPKNLDDRLQRSALERTDEITRPSTLSDFQNRARGDGDVDDGLTPTNGDSQLASDRDRARPFGLSRAEDCNACRE